MKRLLIILISTTAILGILKIVYAGSLTPPSSPGSTYYTLEQIYNPLANTAYDSSGVASSSQGSAMQIAKCVLQKMHGKNC